MYDKYTNQRHNMNKLLKYIIAKNETKCVFVFYIIVVKIVFNNNSLSSLVVSYTLSRIAIF